MQPVPSEPAGLNVIESSPATESKPALTEREHRRRSMSFAFWTVIFAGPFFGTVQGGAIPVLAQVAHLSDRWYGLLQAVPQLALLVQIPGAILISRATSRGWMIFISGMIGRLLWIPIAAIPFIFTGRVGTLTFLGLVFFAWFFQHISGLGWQSWMGDLIPARARGRYFGARVRVIAISSLLTSLALSVALPSPSHAWAKWIVFVIFAAAAIFGAFEVKYYRHAYEPAKRRPALKWRELLKPLHDREFLPFLAFGFLIFASNGIVGPFLWRHLLNGMSMPPLKATLILQTAPLIGTLLMAPLWGKWVDSHGTKAAFIFALVASQIVTLAWPLVTPDHWWVGLLISIIGVCFWVGVDVSFTNKLFAFGSKGGAGYFAAFNATIAVAGFGSTALGGELVERLADAEWVADAARFHKRFGLVFNPYMVLLGVCIMLRIAGVIFMSRFIARDRPTPTIAGVRAMALQMQSGLMGLIYLPVKTMKGVPLVKDVFPD